MKKKSQQTSKPCSHEEVTPVSVFFDDFNNEAWLWQVCEKCGENFLLLGKKATIV